MLMVVKGYLFVPEVFFHQPEKLESCHNYDVHDYVGAM
jgi:hypothetical protein